MHARLLIALALFLAPLPSRGGDREQERRQVRQREVEAQKRALEKHQREDEEAFEEEVRKHPDDVTLQREWRMREARERREQAERARLKPQHPLDPQTPGERGENAVVRLTWGTADACSGVLVGATASTVLILTRARCVADLSDPRAPRPRKLRVEFLLEGAKDLIVDEILAQRIFPGYLDALRRGEAPRDGSDLAYVIAATGVPREFTLLMILQEPVDRLRALVKKPLQVVGFGGGRAAAAGRTFDVVRSCEQKPCDGRTNALELKGASSRDKCTAADAGGATTILYPPTVFLLGLNAAEPGKGGACFTHPLAELGSEPLAWLAQNALSNDFKTCVRDPRTARVTCRDSAPPR